MKTISYHDDLVVEEVIGLTISPENGSLLVCVDVTVSTALLIAFILFDVLVKPNITWIQNPLFRHKKKWSTLFTSVLQTMIRF